LRQVSFVFGSSSSSSFQVFCAAAAGSNHGQTSEPSTEDQFKMSSSIRQRFPAPPRISSTS
jgi:hypothetical protein